MRAAPAARSLGDVDDVALTRRCAAHVGAVLAAAGFDLTFAPVTDVAFEADNPVIGRRSYGVDVATVARHATAAIRGYRDAGIATCTKHFPGHGATRTDSHVDTPVVAGALRELPAFRAVLTAEVPAVMSAHVRYPLLDPDRPATRSGAVLNDLLRRRLRFPGLVVSDTLEMAGFGEGASGEAVGDALRAGVDVLLLARDRAREAPLREALERAADMHPEAIGGALARLDRFLQRLASRARPALAPSLDAAVPVLRAAHERALVRIQGWDGSREDVSAVLLPGDPPGAYVREAAVRRGLGLSPETPILRYGAAAVPGPEAFPERGFVIGIGFRRGARPSAETALFERLAAWGRTGAGRSVGWLMAADHDPSGTWPEAWAVAGLSGCHEGAYEAFASAWFGSGGA